jgi:lipoprotein-anchoring transpeptidase ErfK/SrfK
VNASASKVLSSTTNYGYINQLLAELNYLPFSFTPTTPTSDTSTQTPGTFSPRFSIPLTTKTFNANVANVITRGALMTFQSQNNLRATGTVTVNTYLDLLHAVSINKLDPQPYNYVYVTDRSYNETLVLYKNGVAWSPIAVNTGISLTPTSPGTYPVYLRFRSTTMRGTNPNGTKYDDPDIQWVSYFNGGEGLHEFPRYSYGFPQSLGCVEMSMANAARVWPNTPIGTLVTVYEPA